MGRYEDECIHLILNENPAYFFQGLTHFAEWPVALPKCVSQVDKDIPVYKTYLLKVARECDLPKLECIQVLMSNLNYISFIIIHITCISSLPNSS